MHGVWMQGSVSLARGGGTVRLNLARGVSRRAGGLVVSCSQSPALSVDLALSLVRLLIQWAVALNGHLPQSLPPATLAFGPKTAPPTSWTTVIAPFNASGPGAYMQFRVTLKNLTASAECVGEH